jgi:hypothetical protein
MSESGRPRALDDEKQKSVCSLVAAGVSPRQVARAVRFRAIHFARLFDAESDGSLKSGRTDRIHGLARLFFWRENIGWFGATRRVAGWRSRFFL